MNVIFMQDQLGIPKLATPERENNGANAWHDALREAASNDALVMNPDSPAKLSSCERPEHERDDPDMNSPVCYTTWRPETPAFPLVSFIVPCVDQPIVDEPQGSELLTKALQSSASAGEISFGASDAPSITETVRGARTKIQTKLGASFDGDRQIVDSLAQGPRPESRRLNDRAFSPAPTSTINQGDVITSAAPDASAVVGSAGLKTRVGQIETLPRAAFPVVDASSVRMGNADNSRDASFVEGGLRERSHTRDERVDLNSPVTSKKYEPSIYGADILVKQSIDSIEEGTETPTDNMQEQATAAGVSDIEQDRALAPRAVEGEPARLSLGTQSMGIHVISERIAQDLPAFIARDISHSSQPDGNSAWLPDQANTNEFKTGGRLRVLRFNLQPETLGNLTVRLRITEKNVAIAIETDKTDSLDLLKSSEHDMREVIEATGYKIDAVTIRSLETGEAPRRPGGAWDSGNTANDRANQHDAYDSNRQKEQRRPRAGQEDIANQKLSMGSTSRHFGVVRGTAGVFL